MCVCVCVCVCVCECVFVTLTALSVDACLQLMVELRHLPAQLHHGLPASGGCSVWAGVSPEDVEGHLHPGVLQSQQGPQGVLAGEKLFPAVALALLRQALQDQHQHFINTNNNATIT